MRFVVGFVITGLFVTMPVFWSGLLTWAGHRVGNEVNSSVKEMNSGGKAAGEKGGNVASSAVKGGIKKAK